VDRDVPHWYQLPSAAALDGLRTSNEGLTPAEARRRLVEHGPNALSEGARWTVFGILLGQFTDFMILVLLAAAVISGLIGDVVDTIAIVGDRPRRR
jgi:Ca2+-transporting ATPase